MAENKEILNNQGEQIEGQQIKKPVEGMVDLQEYKKRNIPKDVQNWMEEVEKEVDLNDKNQNNGNNDDSVLQPIAKTPKITLPTDRQTFSDGFGKKFGDAGRWLSEFVFRLIKKNKGNVKFKEE